VYFKLIPKINFILYNPDNKRNFTIEGLIKLRKYRMIFVCMLRVLEFLLKLTRKRSELVIETKDDNGYLKTRVLKMRRLS
jgi:hypothetical protein